MATRKTTNKKRKKRTLALAALWMAKSESKINKININTYNAFKERLKYYFPSFFLFACFITQNRIQYRALGVCVAHSTHNMPLPISPTDDTVNNKVKTDEHRSSLTFKFIFQEMTCNWWIIEENLNDSQSNTMQRVKRLKIFYFIKHLLVADSRKRRKLWQFKYINEFIFTFK